jgi:serine phosphatase RsbU (regulator of sigma subunit)
MKSIILSVVFILILVSNVGSQSNFDGFISEASSSYQTGDYSKALVSAHEAYNAALTESHKVDLCRASLILSESYRELGQYYEALEYGLRCQTISRSISNEYYTAGSMSLINLFRRWGAWEKELEYIDQLNSEKNLDESVQLNLMELKATCLYKLNRLEESSLVLNEIITHLREKGDVIKASEKVLDIALVERKKGQYNSAIMYLMSLTTPEYSGLSDSTLGIIENNIGELYLQLGKFSLAEEHLTLASKKVKPTDSSYSLIFLNLSITQFKQGKNDQALFLLEKSVSKSTTSSEWHNLSVAHSLRAKILAATGDFTGAMESAKIAMNSAERSEETGLLRDVYMLLVGLHMQMGEEDQAREVQKKAELLVEEIKAFSQKEVSGHHDLIESISKKERSIISSVAAAEAESQRLAAELATAKRDKDLTQLKYEKELQEAALFNEQVAKEKAIKELALVQAALMAEQQRFTIVELEKAKSNEQLKVSQLSNQQAERERGIELLKKENELLNSEQQRKNLELQKDAALKKSGLAVLVFISILLVFAVIAFFSTKKKNREIKRNQEAINLINGQLKEKNEEITSSIVFAKNFQEMIIPNEDSFRECMPNSFLIYQPMDIVSGDIPFILDQDDRIYIGAIDCTGHGVPAAMQSFMAYYNLNELIATFPSDSCADLLMKLHRKLSVSTNKSETERSFTSGIDIGLCCIVKSTLQLEFAGANQPLLLLTKDGIDKIQGDRFTVGDMSSKQILSLTNHKRDLSIGDRFYLLSDGFIHQFGGENGNRKYSLKRLMQEIINQKMNSHIRTKVYLEEDMRVWKGATDQTDDIMLIGMEISEPIILK